MNSRVSGGIEPEPRSRPAWRSTMLMAISPARRSDRKGYLEPLRKSSERLRPYPGTPVPPHHKGLVRGQCKSFLRILSEKATADRRGIRWTWIGDLERVVCCAIGANGFVRRVLVRISVTG